MVSAIRPENKEAPPHEAVVDAINYVVKEREIRREEWPERFKSIGVLEMNKVLDILRYAEDIVLAGLKSEEVDASQQE